MTNLNIPAQPLLAFPQLPMAAPQNFSSNEFSSSSRGIASLTFAGRTWRFRTNPNAVNFGYTLNTNIEQTFGGRVVQILSCKIDDLVVQVEAGNAGWAYAANLALFLRDFLDYQRAPQAAPGVFEYTTRRWKFNVYALSIPFQDEVQATVRPLELHFKVQEDISGVVSGAILDATISMLQTSVGWTRTVYNSGSVPSKNGQPFNSGSSPTGQPVNNNNVSGATTTGNNVTSGNGTGSAAPSVAPGGTSLSDLGQQPLSPGWTQAPGGGFIPPGSPR